MHSFQTLEIGRQGELCPTVTAIGGFSGITCFFIALMKNREAVGWGLIGITVLPMIVLLFLPKLPKQPYKPDNS